MKNRTKRAAGLLAATALAFPALAAAEQGERPGHQRGKQNSEQRSNKPRPWNVHGLVTAKGETTVTVKIRRSSHRSRALRDTEVTFDMAAARILVRDANGDGQRNLADVAVGDRAHVKGRVPRRLALNTGQPIPARLGIFRKPRTEEPAEEPAPQTTS
jgi:hypothetical protein